MWSIEPTAVLASSGAESAIGVQTSAAVAAAAPMLLGVMPMGADPDSIAFSAALNACGGAFIGVAEEHAAQRGAMAGGQALSADISVATEVIRASKFSL